MPFLCSAKTFTKQKTGTIFHYDSNKNDAICQCAKTFTKAMSIAKNGP
jgi:hypothetical protein